MNQMVREIQSSNAGITAYFDEYSRRIRVDDYHGPIGEVVKLIDRAITPWAEKLIVKSRPGDVGEFEKLGYHREAFIAGYFSGTDMYFLVRYLGDERAFSPRLADEEALIRSVLILPRQQTSVPAPNIVYATVADVLTLAELYRSSFRIYPTPVGDPVYIKRTIDDGTVYVFIRDGSRIVSAASAEINKKHHNAELTDCATAEGFEGKGYMRALLSELESHLHGRGITCPYTIARSASFGMNKVFHQLGYQFGGRMVKNCMIYSGMEDMNVWFKFENEKMGKSAH